MELTLVRKIFGDDCTIGELQVNGTFECYTLEDKVRAKKIKGKTAIPMGRYDVDITYSQRFKCQMPLLLNVPNFSGIRIHSGNTAADTDGCILVGQNHSANRISSSRLAYTALFAKLQITKDRREGISIDVTTIQADTLIFDGIFLNWFRGGAKYKSWRAVSGRPGYQSRNCQTIKDKGPIPSGKWLVPRSSYQQMPERGWIEMVMAELGRTAWPGGESAWGQQRVWLKPKPGTNTYGRKGFSIHGGASPGSAGCIDLTTSMPEFASEFLKYGKDLELTVT